MWRRALESILWGVLVTSTVGVLLSACGGSTAPTTPVPVPTPVPTPTPTPDPLIPTLVAPADGTHFSLYPRVMVFQWTATSRAVSYRLEMQYQIPTGVWYEVPEVAEIYGTCLGTLTRASCVTAGFAGAGPGRWRVIARASNGDQGSTPWRTFYHER